MNRLTKPIHVEEARRFLAGLLEARGEWFVREQAGADGVALRRGEWELRGRAGRLVFSYWGEAGARAWRVLAWEQRGESLHFEAARRMGLERARLELVPRASVASARAAVALAREAACARMAALAREHAGGARVESARLSEGARRGEPGRYARVVLRRGACGRVAFTGPLVPLGEDEADSFLASALRWLSRLEGAGRGGTAFKLWLFAPPKLSAAVGERIAILREGLRDSISLLEVDEEGRELKPVNAPDLGELLESPPRFYKPARAESGELAASVASLAPEAIDVVRARRGETLRFRGLPFARVRRLMGGERLWFGVGHERGRQLLDGANRDEFLKLIDELREHRRADACDRAHALYRAAPEAWLESLLRRDVTRLDPGLRLAPLHAQFRTAQSGARPVDLLALRADGRLAVVELKVSEDAALPLQGADYWRRVAAQHRAGHVARARLFGDAEVSADPPLLYLAAPLLRFHRSFRELARAITPEIEMYRFDLNENWRGGVRVARRCDLT